MNNLDTNIEYFDRHLNTIRRKFALVCIFLIILATVPVALARAETGWDGASLIQLASSLILFALFICVYLKGYRQLVGGIIFCVDMVLMSVVVLDPAGNQLYRFYFSSRPYLWLIYSFHPKSALYSFILLLYHAHIFVLFTVSRHEFCRLCFRVNHIGFFRCILCCWVTCCYWLTQQY